MPYKLPNSLPLLTLNKYNDQNLVFTSSVTDNISNIDINNSLTSFDITKTNYKNNYSPSPRLLNFVESYTIDNDKWTLFYSEVDTTFKVGDRVFIVNGNYDSDKYIQKNKWKSNIDGYKVLFIDKCKIVLNIPYSGQLPYYKEDIDHYIKVYSCESQREFDYYNSIPTLSNLSDNLSVDYKFSEYQNNILFSNGNYVYNESDSIVIKKYTLDNTNWNLLYSSIKWKDNITYLLGTIIEYELVLYLNTTGSVLFGNPPSIDGTNWTYSSTTSYWSESSTYSVSDQVMYNGDLYEFLGPDNNYYITYENTTPTVGYIGMGFWIRSIDSNQWINITSDFMSGTISSYLSSQTYNNKKVKVIDTSFEYGRNWIADQSYKYDSELGWIEEVTNFVPMICKSNFRGGNFLKGDINGGVYGNPKNKIEYNGSDINWNLGTLFNSVWKEGHMKSLFVGTNSYICNFNDNGRPNQKVNFSNNREFGYNFIFNSDFNNSLIENGNFYKSIIGTGTSFSIVENVLTGVTPSYDLNVKNGYLYDCTIDGVQINKSELRNNRIKNSNIIDSNSINSQIDDTYFLNSQFNSDKLIKINSYKEFNIRWVNSDSTIKLKKLYKFYISDDSYQKLKTFDYIFFNGLKTNEPTLLNFFDKKFILDSYVDSEDVDVLQKKEFDTICYLSSKIDNTYKSIYPDISNTNLLLNINSPKVGDTLIINDIIFTYRFTLLSPTDILLNTLNDYTLNNTISVLNSSLTDFVSASASYDVNGFSIKMTALNENVFNIQFGQSSVIYTATWDKSRLNTLFPYELNTNRMSSIDIICDNGLDFNIGLTSSYPALDLGNNIDVSNAYIINSSFKNGLFDASKWINGYYYNHNIDYNMTDDVSTGYPIQIDSLTQSTLRVTLDYDRVGDDSLSIGKIIYLNNIYYKSNVPDPSFTNSIKLNNYYKITNITKNSDSVVLIIKDLLDDIIPYIPNVVNGIFTTIQANNAYNWIHTNLFRNSTIKNGILKRPFLLNSTVQNDNVIDVGSLTKDLIITDIVVGNTGNTFKSGVVQWSSIISGNDVIDGSVINESYFDGSKYNWSTTATGLSYSTTDMIFQSGTFQKSNWVWGIFNNGYFINNRTNTPGQSGIYNNTIKSYWLKRYASDINNKNSWKDGIFNNGVFKSSLWESGTFSNGLFIQSDFMSGSFMNGDFGTNQIPYSDTRFWSGIFYNGKVINGLLLSDDPLGLNSPTSINWLNGQFNGGVFGNSTQSTNTSAIWNDGQFNGGEFKYNTKWMNGKFNGGKFISTYGSTILNPTQSSEYSWENGEFNGGEFGNAQFYDNSTWNLGEFNGGKFVGRLWNDGVFTSGDFNGGATISPVGGLSSSNANTFVSGFTNSYYGLWRKGIVTDFKDKFFKDKKIVQLQEKSSSINKLFLSVNFNNMLWLGGTFSHSNGNFNTSVWLDGCFENGTFKSSSFNPYVQPIDNTVFTNQVQLLNNPNFDSDVSNWTLYNMTYSVLNQNISYNKTTPFLVCSSTQNIALDGGKFYKVEFSYTASNSFKGYINVFGVTNSSYLYKGFNYNISSNNTIDWYFEISQTGSYIVGVSASSLTSATYGLYFDNFSLYEITNNGFKFNTSDSCYWKSGNLDQSDFYISKWENGNFIYGTATGMIFKDGIVNYMNAYNIFWEGGTWKNGNWYGSPFDVLRDDGFIYDDYTRQIIYRGVEWNLNNECHLWNVFDLKGDYDDLIINEDGTYSESSSLEIWDELLIVSGKNK